MLGKSALEKSTGRFISEKFGEKARLGLKVWLLKSPLKPGVKTFCGVGALFECIVSGAGRFCGIC